MTVFYWSKNARITEETFESVCLPGLVIPVRELSHVHTARHSPLVLAGRSVSVRICSGSAVGLPTLVQALDALTHGPSWLPRACFLFTTAGLVLTAGLAMLRRRTIAIRALYRGSLICLFHTRDHLVIGQVSRALLRVLELARGER
jgi:hypothetical protein